MKRTNHLKIRTSDQEDALIRRSARARGMLLQEYCVTILVREALKEMPETLRREVEQLQPIEPEHIPLRKPRSK